LVRYVHLNPVRAGMVKRPGEWRWSGHGEYLKGKKGVGSTAVQNNLESSIHGV
jgi:hypothetical protein